MLIAQISDPHIRPSGVLYQGLVDSNEMLSAAVRQVNSLEPRPDLVLLTGDITDHGTADEFAHARALLAPLQVPLLAIPGNHDEREAFRAAFGGDGRVPDSGPIHYVADDLGPVRIVALDVTIPGRHHGLVDDAALDWLARVLADAPARPTLLMLHQPPFETGIPYMDPYRCFDGDRLDALLRRHPAVERVVCGHVHRVMQRRFGGTLLVTAPSTTTTIALRLAPDAAPASYREPAGFLLHHWTPAGGMLTHSCLIGDFGAAMPFA